MGNGCSPSFAGDIFVGVLFHAVFFFPTRWSKRGSGTGLSQFLRIFLPTYAMQTLDNWTNVLYIKSIYEYKFDLTTTVDSRYLDFGYLE